MAAGDAGASSRRKMFASDKLCNRWLICASELPEFLDMAINVKKSACMRFGPQFKNARVDIVVSSHSIKWEMSARYRDVYLESCTKFKCSFSKNKARYFKVF